MAKKSEHERKECLMEWARTNTSITGSLIQTGAMPPIRSEPSPELPFSAERKTFFLYK